LRLAILAARAPNGRTETVSAYAYRNAVGHLRSVLSDRIANAEACEGERVVRLPRRMMRGSYARTFAGSFPVSRMLTIGGAS